MKMLRKVLCLLLVLFLPSSCVGETVVTSFYPIWLLALNLTDGIGGLQVRNLAAPETGCLHDYQLQTGDMKLLSEADIFLINGAGMETFLEPVLSAFPDLKIADASAGIPLLHDSGALQIGDSGSEEEEESVNAHIWLSAKNAARMAQNLAEGLSSALPAHREQIQRNLDRLTARLLALDEEMRAGLSPFAGRGIITFHEAFPYFASAYGLKVLAVVNREPGETLTASQLAALAEAIVSLGVPPLFAEPQYEDLSARILASETGAKIYTLDPVVTGPDTDPPLDYYETVMRQNLSVLQEALSE